MDFEKSDAGPLDIAILELAQGGHRYIYLFTTDAREKLMETLREQRAQGDIPGRIARAATAVAMSLRAN